MDSIKRILALDTVPLDERYIQYINTHNIDYLNSIEYYLIDKPDANELYVLFTTINMYRDVDVLHGLLSYVFMDDIVLFSQLYEIALAMENTSLLSELNQYIL